MNTTSEDLFKALGKASYPPDPAGSGNGQLMSVEAWTRAVGRGRDRIAAALAAQVGPAFVSLSAMSPERRTFVNRVCESMGADPADMCAHASRWHAYETGVMIELADLAGSVKMRASERLSSRNDPVLCAIAAGAGRGMVHPEGFGAWSHWIAEMAAGGPLKAVSVDAGVEAMLETIGALA